MDPHSEERLALVCPLLAERARKADTMLRGEGIDIRVIQGLRTWGEQDALYAKGRTIPPIGKKFTVTNAKGGQSWHNLALAIDVAPDDPTKLGWQPDWNPGHPAWKRIVAVGESVGLVSGVSFHDLPHFQLTGRFPFNKPDEEALYLFREGGAQAVWDEVMKTERG